MKGNTLELIGEERAATTAFFVIGAEHEVINRELVLTAEELLERLLSFISIKRIRLVNFQPWLGETFFVKRIVLFHERLFFSEHDVAMSLPFFFRSNDFMCFEKIWIDLMNRVLEYYYED